jgi:hypothetical protein
MNCCLNCDLNINIRFWCVHLSIASWQTMPDQDKDVVNSWDLLHCDRPSAQNGTLLLSPVPRC